MGLPSISPMFAIYLPPSQMHYGTEKRTSFPDVSCYQGQTQAGSWINSNIQCSQINLAKSGNGTDGIVSFSLVVMINQSTNEGFQF